MILLFLIATGLLVAAVGGIAIGLFLAGVLDWTSKPEDELARRDRRTAARA